MRAKGNTAPCSRSIHKPHRRFRQQKKQKGWLHQERPLLLFYDNLAYEISIVLVSFFSSFFSIFGRTTVRMPGCQSKTVFLNELTALLALLFPHYFTSIRQGKSTMSAKKKNMRNTKGNKDFLSVGCCRHTGVNNHCTMTTRKIQVL